MNHSEIDWRGGIVTHWDLSALDLNRDIRTQLDLLKEDLAQVHYGSNIILDLGWLPEFELTGRFVLCIIKSSDWENPVLRVETANLRELCGLLERGVQAASLME
jgi:hypothetical protein